MMELFSTREIALGIYAVLLIAYIFAKKTTRKAAAQVVKTACTRNLAIPFALLIIYASIIVWVLTQFRFWKWSYIKDISVWVLFAGVPLCFKAVDHKDEHYFRDSITSNLKLTAVVEFFTGTFTFPFLVELLIQPVLTFLVLVQEFSKRDKKYNNISTFIDVIFSVAGLWILYATINEAIEEYAQRNATDLIVGFCIPVVFSIFYLPVAYLLAVYAKYEVLFVRMDFSTAENKHTRKKYKLKVMQACGLSYNNICRFERDYLCCMYRTMPEQEFNDLIAAFKRKMPEQ